MPSNYTATIGARSFNVTMLPGSQVSVDGAVRCIDLVELGRGLYSLIIDGRVYSLFVPAVGRNIESSPSTSGERDLGTQICLVVDGIEYDVRVDNEHSLAIRSLVAQQGDPGAIHVVKAPMPGIISRLEVEVGDKVSPGKGLLVLEAMKMENEIRSLTEGTVRALHVARGKIVEKGEPLVTIHGL
jgi:hypothetical protein